jgi:CPA2 family monovalent cation:H+ antiporter-2
VEELHQARLQSVTLPEAGASVGQRLEALALHAVGVEVVSIRRARGNVIEPAPELELGAGDTLVLSGLPEPLALAEEKLLRG